MNRSYLHLFTLFFAVISCETNPQICMEFKATPVVYAIFDRADTISHIYLVKSFSGDPQGPLINSRIADSIYYNEVLIAVEFKYQNTVDDTASPYIRKWEPAFEETVTDRDPGIFIYPYGRRYIIFQDLDSCYHVGLTILTAPFDTIKVSTPVISPPVMDYPQADGSWITMHRTKTLPIRWFGYEWNELNVEIEIETTTQDSHTILDTLVYYKKNIIYPDDLRKMYYVSSFSFESYLALLNSQLKFVPNVKYRRITNVSFEVICGNMDFKEYMNQFGELIDNVLTTYHSGPNSLVTSKSSRKITGLRFDPESIEQLEGDSALAKYKFVYW